MKLNKGDKVEYISSSGNWSKVRYNEKKRDIICDTDIKSVSTTSTSTDIRIITGNSVNFRKGPGTNYSVIRSFNKGTKVEFISKEDDWVKVNYNGTVGYVFSKYVSDRANTDDNTYITKYVTGNSVNVRTGPSTSYKSTMKFKPRKQIVEYISSSGNWSKIMYNGKTGYMSSQYLSTTNPIENTKPETQGEVLFPDWFKEGKNILARDDYASNLVQCFYC